MVGVGSEDSGPLHGAPRAPGCTPTGARAMGSARPADTAVRGCRRPCQPTLCSPPGLSSKPCGLDRTHGSSMRVCVHEDTGFGLWAPGNWTPSLWLPRHVLPQPAHGGPGPGWAQRLSDGVRPGPSAALLRHPCLACSSSLALTRPGCMGACAVPAVRPVHSCGHVPTFPEASAC